MKPISNARLTLEPQTAAHAAEMFVVLCDPALYAFEGEPPESLEWLRARYARLESRQSKDGSQIWLNWVIRLPNGAAAGPAIGFVQAAADRSGRAAIAYVLASAHWGRGLARLAVEMMIGELVDRHSVTRLFAELKRDNARSRHLLVSLGFYPATPAQILEQGVAADEIMMLRDAIRAG
jgi:RimJ/RimL family protein N-acetyltransferase